MGMARLGYLQAFGVLFLLAGLYLFGRALATGAAHVRGMKEPILRKERSRDYWFVMGVCIFLWVILVCLLLTS